MFSFLPAFPLPEESPATKFRSFNEPVQSVRREERRQLFGPSDSSEAAGDTKVYRTDDNHTKINTNLEKSKFKID
jgi:hypothetical protein